ncbi:thiamine pyrophosphate-dependent dehydrogenase E1 component subunit alpha [Candidatus Omnitrophota bacterium]
MKSTRSTINKKRTKRLNNLSVELYKKVCLIRRSEEKIIEHYFEDEMKTPMHMSMGEEAIVAGVCQALRKEDQVFGTYRSHGLYLAKTQDVDNFFAEMYGKETSLLKGKGGSMHLCAPDGGFMGTSAIVATAISVAVGAAFANKRLGSGKTVAVFFGDGALDEGAFWESLNVACAMKIPVLFICEDNDLAVHTPTSARQGYKSITEIVSQFNCHVLEDETTDAEAIYGLAQKAIGLIQSAQKPCFMHLKYYRYLEHVGVKEDFDAGYRSQEEFKKWQKVDPIELQRAKLIAQGCSEDEIKSIEADIEAQINKSVAKAKKASFAQSDELYKDVL